MHLRQGGPDRLNIPAPTCAMGPKDRTIRARQVRVLFALTKMSQLQAIAGAVLIVGAIIGYRIGFSKSVSRLVEYLLSTMQDELERRGDKTQNPIQLTVSRVVFTLHLANLPLYLRGFLIVCDPSTTLAPTPPPASTTARLGS